MPRDCPVCGLVCSDTAVACDCGYSFAQASTVGRIQLNAAARRNMLIGGLICFTGVCVTVLTVATAEVTGISIVAWGAIVVGAAQLIRGLLQARRQRLAEQQQAASPEPHAPPDRPRD